MAETVDDRRCETHIGYPGSYRDAPSRMNVERAQMGEETKSIISEKQNELIEQQKENHLRFKEQWLHVQNEMIKQHKEVRGKVLQCYYTALEDNDTNS